MVCFFLQTVFFFLDVASLCLRALMAYIIEIKLIKQSSNLY
uniref:Uncharacterized protein n=1 Tax=Rhizophora mucronata TaxID=61149 RepID=A0A2P2PI59_RHIMU